MRLVIVVVIIATLVWLGYKFWRLVWYQGMMGAHDMRQFYEWTHTWSAGDPVYDGTRSVTYPPASLVILWPLPGRLRDRCRSFVPGPRKASRPLSGPL